MKICLITCAKDEDNYIEEFLEHYFDIVGIDHVFWIDNNTPPLKPVEINDDRVTVIDKRDVNFDNGEDTPLNIMKSLVNETYQKYVVGSEYDWCCYFDTDELLEINPKYGSLKEMLMAKNKYDVLLFPWVMHGNNNYIFESELPSNRMKINYGYEYNYKYSKLEFKPMFKTRPEYVIDINFFNPFSIILNCDESKIKIDKKSKLHHYRIQCLETYIKHKIINGFYGQKNKAHWCRHLFFSSQFRKSNIVIKKERERDLIRLLEKYDLIDKLSNNDKKYFKHYFDITI